MVVLAASITTVQGNPIVSRQFHDISKDRMLELLSNFQNLVSKGSKNHNFIEDGHIRYIYKPLDDFYIILITNRQSNIIQDLKTLDLMNDSIINYLNYSNGNISEWEIFDLSFDIITIFDEIIINGGYKENLTTQQISTYLAMESHEERIQEIIEKNKEIEANEERKRRAKEIARREQERKQFGGLDYPGQSFVGSNDPNVANALNSYYSHASPAAQQSYVNSQQQQQQQFQTQISSPTENVTNRIGGMKLSQSRNIHKPSASGMGNYRSSSTPSNVSATRPETELHVENNGILVTLKESIQAQLTRDGDLQNYELKGSLDLRINNEEYSHAQLKLVSPPLNILKDRSYKFETHPNIDKGAFLSQGIISLKDKEKKAFPANDQSRSVLRWKKNITSDNNNNNNNNLPTLPLSVNTWVSENDTNIFDVTIEFEINNDKIESLEDLYFVVPVLPTKVDVQLNEESNECGAEITSINDEEGIVIKVSRIEAGSQGVINFVVEAEFEDALFPISVTFHHNNTDLSIADKTSLIGVSVGEVIDSLDGTTSLPYDVITSLKTDQFTVM
ncbi:hypothetical protein RI543_003857 [Arxiozyma heterogenica]|uniref:Coatomer subunit delta n=1 Tax=Arxiozyma heterogenica TaxID=278026 RepID=A0AAN7WIN5_9SACH|nr:hypothetical protein RI543_003857 [Kazachstania heterogenica]